MTEKGHATDANAVIDVQNSVTTHDDNAFLQQIRPSRVYNFTAGCHPH